MIPALVTAMLYFGAMEALGCVWLCLLGLQPICSILCHFAFAVLHENGGMPCVQQSSNRDSQPIRGLEFLCARILHAAESSFGC